VKQKRQLVLVLAILILASFACNMPGFSGEAVTPTVEIHTQVASTINALMTSVAQQTQQPGQNATTGTPAASATLPPTVTLPPTYTPISPPTITPIPCNWAQFVDDVTIPDDQAIQAGSSFVKTWRLKNIGTCTWTSSHQLIFVSGESMGAPASVSMTSGSVPPGGTVDVSVSLTAPSSAGTHVGYFKLKAPDGLIFGIGNAANGAFYVKINSVVATTEAPTATTVKLPDLKITQITFDPAEPTHGSPVHVKVSVYNNGNAATSGSFTVKWWGLESFANPSCSWTVDDVYSAHGGRVLECDFTYASPYAPNLNSKATADTDDTIAESNEGNNTLKVPVTVH
jgi:hypothetical protein